MRHANAPTLLFVPLSLALGCADGGPMDPSTTGYGFGAGMTTDESGDSETGELGDSSTAPGDEGGMGAETETGAMTESGDGDGDGDGDGVEPAVCGDGIVIAPEVCDDGNANEDDGCTSLCAFPRCGDGFVQAAETCDDANEIDDDGCDRDCEPSAVLDVAAGRDFTCAHTRTGAVRCWGANDEGQLGTGNTAEVLTANEARSVVMPPALQIDAHDAHACALLENGTVSCWGRGYQGALGRGGLETIGDDEAPGVGIGLGVEVVEVLTGSRHSCARTSTGALHCWGRNTVGQLGVPFIDEQADASAAAPVTLDGAALRFTLGGQHTCVVIDSPVGPRGGCWGRGLAGVLGNQGVEDLGDDELPMTAGFSGVGPFVQLSAGDAHTCGLREDGSVWCWGEGDDGRLGGGNELDVGDDEFPYPVPLGAPPLDQVAVLGRSTCVRIDGQVHCWGRNDAGQLGRGHTEAIGDDEGAYAAGWVALGFDADAVVGGYDHACALGTGGELRCWGLNDRGQLGLGHTENLGDDEAVDAEPMLNVFTP